MTTEKTDSLPTVQTRQVTVQVLTIGAKQVTQAMYRQLLEKPLIDGDTGKLNGNPWGWVNLHLDCDKKPNHQHVIWEQDGKLYRDVVNRRFGSQRTDRLENDLDAWIEIYVRFVALSGGKIPVSRDGRWFIRIQERNIALIDPTFYLREFLKGNDNLRGEVIAELNREVKLRHSDATPCQTLEQTHTYMKSLADQLNEIELNVKHSKQAIEDAGQLFIAVSGVWK